jgi:hypothetical protein
VIILDSLLFGGLKFVLSKIAQLADAELNDESALREELLAAQMRVELGEMSEEDFARLEGEILPRMRELRAQTIDEGAAAGGMIVTGAEVRAWDEDEE